VKSPLGLEDLPLLQPDIGGPRLTALYYFGITPVRCDGILGFVEIKCVFWDSRVRWDQMCFLLSVYIYSITAKRSSLPNKPFSCYRFCERWNPHNVVHVFQAYFSTTNAAQAEERRTSSNYPGFLCHLWDEDGASSRHDQITDLVLQSQTSSESVCREQPYARSLLPGRYMDINKYNLIVLWIES
jgi:hypothetical protein